MGEDQRDLGTTARRIAQGKNAAMLFHDLVDDGKAEAGPLCSGGHIRLRQTVAMLAWQAATIVCNL